MSGKPVIVACIPAFREEDTIAKVVIQTLKYVDKVIVCDDGSDDMTADIAEKVGAFVIRNEHKGKGYALTTALRYAGKFNPEIVVTLDSDGQHDPSDIQRLIQPIIEDKADMVVGSRYVDGSKWDPPLYRRFGLWLINKFSRKSCKDMVKDTQCGFRAYSAKALEIIQQCEAKGYSIELEQLALAAKNGLRIVEVPVIVRYKELRRTSKQNPLRHSSELIGAALRLIVEERPLLLLGAPGALLTTLGILGAIYLLWYFNLTRYFSIPIALITIGALFIGIMLFVASILLYAMNKVKSQNKIR